MSQTFAELGLNPELIAGLEKLGYERPTKLQTDAIPHLLAGRDVVAEAPHGSGRTAAYVLPILQTIDPEVQGVQIVVVVDSGERAVQVAQFFHEVNSGLDLQIVPLHSGQPVTREAERLGAATNIVVGTAKRINEHLERESFTLENVHVAVLDGERVFSDKVQEILQGMLDQMPPDRQTIIFASELNDVVQELAEQHLFEPMVLRREATQVPIPQIKHRYQMVTSDDKNEVLAQLLDGENVVRAIIYVGRGPEAAEVAGYLQALGYSAVGLNKNSDSERRESVLRNWREGNIAFMVLTDGAAEDLVAETDYAISYDIAPEAEVYASRVKLVNENGTHFTLVSPRERRLLAEIETFMAQRIKAVLPPARASIVAQRTEGFKQRLRDIIARSNLEVYMLLLNDLAEEGYDWSEIAAAAVSLVQHTQADTIFTRRPDRRSAATPRYRESVRPNARPRDEEREVEAGYVRLVMDAGYDIGVRPKDIVGAIANEANIPGRAVGNIDIRDRFTFVEVQEDYIDRVLTRVPSTRLRGRIVTFRRA
ncbi:MAG: DEAD/DEAH box helicase [Caldilineae bacterium]|nr:MAG: DEAD/DEAH box helicase [Caldilineae bacterium]